MLRKLCLPVLLCVVATSAFAQSTTVRVTADRTSVRDRAATDGAVVATVTKGDELMVLSTTGSWLKVRTKAGAEGFVHSLFTEGGPGPSASTSTSTPTVSPMAAPMASGGASAAPRSVASSSASATSDRNFGVGIGGGGLAAAMSPSMRYWMSDKTALEVGVSLYRGTGWTNTAISPSILMRFKQPTTTGSVTFVPYYGGGITYWKLSNSYWASYFGPEEISTSGLGFGGFVGSEAIFEKLPRFTVSGNAGYYTSPAALGYGGIYLALGFHYYFK